ncbi:ImmA/IrrE family metallo-endopeptidase [Sporolactobacillus shoreicorticis]|uniref:ImmA/IrrE family metallo-endopeptidase n=1 Tax=Sporolactobacillus shoreicorticis TaxID=1923877 RepID=A0ABW5RZL2_9BACL|nr:ImmA/IrrE family metallo-endopeptidase [Sporolactobacillus shoreicorticis]MCO7125157.1 ImmA/IrrE family metallo-endopeptidase [Sporolactobacillus shoreicorticis]
MIGQCIKIIISFHTTYFHTEDLELKKIAIAFRIEYSCWHGQPYAYRLSENSAAYIIENKQVAEYEQREHFFHELGHIVRHCGDQCDMPELFLQMQEAEARQFALYAAIPYHMIDFNRTHSLKSIMQEFHFTLNLAYTRIDGMCQQIIVQQNGSTDEKRCE